MARVRDRRRSDQLFEPPKRFDAPDGYLCGSHPEWCQTRRTAGHSVDQVRAGYQSKDGKGDRPGDSANAARHCRRGARIVGRREFRRLLGGLVATLPVAAGAQEVNRARLVGVLMATAADEDQQVGLDAFLQALKQLGWVEGRNVRFDIRWGQARATETGRHAAELAALAPAIIFGSGETARQYLLREARTIPIVFCNLADPVGAGFINSLARPGGNATGFIQFEYTLSAKWLELLKQIVPGLVRVAVFRDAENTAGIGQFAVIQSVASALGVEGRAINMAPGGGSEGAVNSFGPSPKGGPMFDHHPGGGGSLAQC